MTNKHIVMKALQLRLVLLVITLILISCKQGKQKQEDKANSVQNEIAFPSFEQYFNNLENFSGNVLVAVDGKPIFEKSYGYSNIELKVKNTSETKFRI